MNKEILECYTAFIPAMKFVDKSHKYWIDLLRFLSLCSQGFHGLKWAEKSEQDMV